MDDLDKRIAALSPAKRMMLQQRLQAKGLSDQKGVIPRRSSQAAVPLSFAQERLWFLDQLEPGSCAYNIPQAFRLTGVLDVAALRDSLQEIVRRHEALRTTFQSRENGPVQIIGAAEEFDLQFTDLTSLVAEQRESEARRLTEEYVRIPFDLATGPLIKAKLLQLGLEDHIFLVNVHHAISDGWSQRVFYGELALIYQAFIEEKPSPLPELPVQYADFAVWQREWLKGAQLEKQLNYWLEKMAGAPSSLTVSTRRQPAADKRKIAASESLELSVELVNSLSTFCLQEGVTVFMALLAAFKVLLARRTGQDDLVIGIPIAGRNHDNVEKLIGFFVNTLPLRTDLSDKPTFKQVLSRVKTTALEAYVNQDLPFEKLIEALKPERSMVQTPVFQVFFNMLNLESSTPSFAGLKVEQLPLPDQQAKFDLTVYTTQISGRIRFQIVYKAELFCAETVRILLQQYKVLLEQIVLNPLERIDHYTLLRTEDRMILPDPKIPLLAEKEQLIHHGFLIQAKQFPQRIGVIEGENIWTYGDLEILSNRLANSLLKSGVRPGEVVGIYASPSSSLIWCLLGVLKAGAMFLILDSAYPAERLSRYLKQARPVALLYLGSCGELPKSLSDYAASLSIGWLPSRQDAMKQ